ncbi:hypothetical protein VMCG_10940 [Cytospora schulzeri]|uniref:Carbonic anhydrase n=1 Tax=Cytospora schulzeri TaxID=448051 RepID=A0A423V7L9_9PEZI|nr:hypothetical protein VMCG_10940 [Valsa malicola]
MTTPNVENLKEKNATYASHFKHGHLALPPAKRYLIVTCMDARIDPISAFGISLGDAHVIRNAGGSAKESLRSIMVSEQLLGTNEIMVIKHTGCGMLTFTNEDAHAVVAQELGPTAAAEISTLDFMPFTNVENAVKEDVEFLGKQSSVPKDVTVTGWVYEVETGQVRQVV